MWDDTAHYNVCNMMRHACVFHVINQLNVETVASINTHDILPPSMSIITM